jgi:hypothetical protein
MPVENSNVCAMPMIDRLADELPSDNHILKNDPKSEPNRVLDIDETLRQRYWDRAEGQILAL